MFRAIALSRSRFAPVRSIKRGFAASSLMSRPPLLFEEGSWTPQSLQVPIFHHNAVIIQGMRVQRWLFLLIGFAVGFGVLYSWEKQRAPDVVKALPLEVDPNVPTQLPPQNPGASAEPVSPPVDMARVKELTEKIKQNPKDFDSIVELGNLNFDQKNYDDSIKLYKEALAIRPDALNVRTDMGTAMFYLNRYDDAIATFQEVLKTQPNDAQALFNLGVAMLHGKNDPKRALEYWEKLVETNPNHPQAAFVREQIKKLKEQPQNKP